MHIPSEETRPLDNKPLQPEVSSTLALTLTWQGEPLSDLSDQYDVAVETLAAANRLPLRWRQIITVPGGVYPSFAWPLGDPSSVRITQGFQQNHQALDLAGPLSNPVVAAKAGVVRWAGWYDDAYGNLVIIDHSGGYSSWYAHLERINVATGQPVGIGDQLGPFGATGQVTGPHLHFEIRYHNRCQDPTLFLNTKEIP